MLHRTLLAVIVAASFFAHGQSIPDRGRSSSDSEGIGAISLHEQGQREDEDERQAEVTERIEEAPTMDIREGLVEAEIRYEDRESAGPAPVALPIDTRP